MSYLDITNGCSLLTVFHDSLGFNEVWKNNRTIYTCVWINNMKSNVPSTIYKKEIQ